MNARIKEIYNRVVGDDKLNLDSYLAEKFAELIVQECMSCATWVGQVNTHPAEPINTAHAINKRIQQRLGVNL